MTGSTKQSIKPQARMDCFVASLLSPDDLAETHRIMLMERTAWCGTPTCATCARASSPTAIACMAPGSRAAATASTRPRSCWTLMPRPRGLRALVRRQLRAQAGRSVADLARDERDNAAYAPLAAVDRSRLQLGRRLRPRARPGTRRSIDEMHVKGFTLQHPGCRSACAAPTRAWPPRRDRSPEGARRYRGRAVAGAPFVVDGYLGAHGLRTTGATTHSNSSPRMRYRSQRSRRSRSASSRRW